ncbi:MAG: TldD/PmbA family protein [Candidatus Stygibacter australis]|nr:TldD/PmbA family protein [Candidatus Stygibacter australis]MDP8322260.1 TldD/PmbA family protein [Candidatus Stygibacter australis]
MKNDHIMQEIINKLLERGADKVTLILIETRMEELQFEYNEIDLLRGYDENSLSIKVIKDNKLASTSLNQMDEAALEAAMDQVLADAENSQPDEAHDISPFQEAGSNIIGELEPDRDRMYFLINEFLEERQVNYPTLMAEGTLVHYLSQERYLNSNGVDFRETQGGYIYTLMFSSRLGDKVSSFNYTYNISRDLKKSFLEVGMTRDLIEQSIASMECRHIPDTFKGDVILVPGLVKEFWDSLILNQISDSPLINDSSVLKGKIGEKVLHESINLCSDPTSEDLANSYFSTKDGFRAEKVEIIGSGMLQNYLLSYYGSRKTGLPMSKARGCLIMSPGKDKLADMIKNVKKGLLVVRFSGGGVSLNCDFSGVAKNSYYIENGEIMYPVNETMISGNLLQLFNNIEGISDQILNNGDSKMPWLHCSGVTISK